MNVAMNKQGYDSFESVLNNGMRTLSPNEFEINAENTNALILDTRNNEDFFKAHIPQSINIGINGAFAPWVGTLISDVKQPILLITENGQEAETVTRLARVGFDNQIGHLEGGIKSWIEAGKETAEINRISAQEFEELYKPNSQKIIDVRKESEYEAEHIENAFNKPLNVINDWIKDIDPKEHFYLHCGGGYRSMTAASILQAIGYRYFTKIEGGFNAIAKTSVPRSNFICQSKVYPKV